MNMKEYITLLNEAKLLDAKLTSREARPTPDEKATPCLQEGGVTHTAPSKYHDGIISLAFIHTKSGEPTVIMVFRRAIQKAPLLQVALLMTCRKKYGVENPWGRKRCAGK
jgi:hypothetical protein